MRERARIRKEIVDGVGYGAFGFTREDDMKIYVPLEKVLEIISAIKAYEQK